MKRIRRRRHDLPPDDDACQGETTIIQGLKHTVPAQQDGRRSDVSLLRDFNNRFRGQEWSSSAAQWAVRGYVNALLLAEINNLLLRETGVVLDLVHSRDNSCMRKQLLEISLAVIGNTNGLDFAGGHQLLHILPCVNVRTGMEEISLSIRQFWKQAVSS
jgi:hypothetical protein